MQPLTLYVACFVLALFAGSVLRGNESIEARRGIVIGSSCAPKPGCERRPLPSPKPHSRRRFRTARRERSERDEIR